MENGVPYHSKKGGSLLMGYGFDDDGMEKKTLYLKMQEN